MQHSSYPSSQNPPTHQKMLARYISITPKDLGSRMLITSFIRSPNFKTPFLPSFSMHVCVFFIRVVPYHPKLPQCYDVSIGEKFKAANFASRLLTTSGSGAGSTFCGGARWQRVHLWWPHRTHSKGSIISPMARPSGESGWGTGGYVL
jgi:hypothetical protein